MKKGARAALAVVLLSLLGRLVYGRGFESYDPMWSLLWGRDVIHGRLPAFEALDIAPVPHPLALLVGIVAAPFGQAGPAVMAAVGHLSLGLLGWAAWRLGRALFGVAVGVGFALVLLVSPPLVDESLQAVVDLPFLALVLWAAALEAERPGEGDAPFAVLAVAGLLRPEAWLLSVVLLAVRGRAGDGWRSRRRIALVVVAPLVWTLMDLVVTGDPLHSLRGAKELGDLLGVSAGLDAALAAIPDVVRGVLPGVLAWLGLAGLVTGIALRWEPSRLPAALLGLGLAGWVVLGVAGIPFELRYGFVPASMLGLFVAAGALGWTGVEAGALRSRWRAAGLAAAAIGIVLGAGPVAHELSAVMDRRDARVAVRASLRDVVTRPAADRALHACRPLLVRRFLLVPAVAYRAGIDPAAITVDEALPPRAALAAQGGTLPPVSAGGAVAQDSRWRVHARCRADPATEVP